VASPLDVAKGRLFVLLWLLVVLDLGLDWLALRRVAEALLAVLMLAALVDASRHIRVLSLVLFAGTGWLVWRAGDWAVLERGLHGALAIGAFLPVVVLVRATVTASPAVPAIRERVGAMPRTERFAWMTGGAVLLGAILTLGYVSVLRPLLPERLEPGERLALAEAGTRGLGLACLWSPFFVASAVAGQLVPTVAAWQMVALGLALSALGAGVAHLMFGKGLDRASATRALRRLGPIVPPCVLLVGAVTVAGALTGWNTLQSVVVVVPALCAAFFVLRARSRAGSALRQVLASAGRISDEVLIMTASAVFGAAMAGATMPEQAMVVIRAVADWPVIAIGASVALITTLGVIGLHPMVSASVLVPALVAMQLPIDDRVLAHVVLLGWALSSTVAAWTLPLVVSSVAFEVPVRQLVFGPNLRFIAVFGSVAVGALGVLNHLLD
jgi:hypothetical protein